VTKQVQKRAGATSNTGCGPQVCDGFPKAQGETSKAHEIKKGALRGSVADATP
jgi:hypothetical protein